MAFSLLFLVMADIDAKWDQFQKCIKAVKPDVRVYDEDGGCLLFAYNDPNESPMDNGGTHNRFCDCVAQQTQNYAVSCLNIAHASKYDEDQLAILHRDDTEEVKRYLWPEDDEN